MTANHEQLATPLFKACTLQVNQTPILNHLYYIISFALVNNLCYNKSMKGENKMNKTINEVLDIIEGILDWDTLWEYEYYEKKELPLSWEVDRDTLMKIKELLESLKEE